MKFAMVYSCGKDSTLALHKMIEQGHEAVCLVVMANKEADRSYFHGADRAMLDRYSCALDLPIFICPAGGEDYHLALENGLKRAKDMGAEGAAFGDIDICGENGEYHTLAVDGPVFRSPVTYQLGKKLILEHHAVIDIR